ncbi:hypothetical protein AV530_011211 [Patagioenas fasciata monilis]|uniref:Uncharacterized protein n=1 Tax=Patagioenas fasciata monilis TaxID=372326 RepID=A0A1V4KNH0_PATFA|nr:hypothetical protein AV530_011211 [Patagioenas fasciata monilis]
MVATGAEANGRRKKNRPRKSVSVNLAGRGGEGWRLGRRTGTALLERHLRRKYCPSRQCWGMSEAYKCLQADGLGDGL